LQQALLGFLLDLGLVLLLPGLGWDSIWVENAVDSVSMSKLSLFIDNFRLYCVQVAVLLYLPCQLVITLSELGLFCTLW